MNKKFKVSVCDGTWDSTRIQFRWAEKVVEIVNQNKDKYNSFLFVTATAPVDRDLYQFLHTALFSPCKMRKKKKMVVERGETKTTVQILSFHQFDRLFGADVDKSGYLLDGYKTFLFLLTGKIASSTLALRTVYKIESRLDKINEVVVPAFSLTVPNYISDMINTHNMSKEDYLSRMHQLWGDSTSTCFETPNLIRIIKSDQRNLCEAALGLRSLDLPVLVVLEIFEWISFTYDHDGDSFQSLWKIAMRIKKCKIRE